MKKIVAFLLFILVFLPTSAQDALELAKEAYQKAAQLKKEQKFAESVPYLQKVVTYFEQIGEKGSVSQTLAEIADSYWNAQDYENARLTNEKRLILCQSLKDINCQKYVLADLGQLAIIHEKNTEKARKNLLASIDLCQSPDDNALLIYNYEKLSLIYKTEKQYTEARNCQVKLRELYQKAGQTDKEAYTFWESGLMFTKEKNYQDALNSFEKALPYYKNQLKDTTNTAILLSNIGRQYNFLKNHDKALAFFQQSIDTYQLKKDSKGQAGIYVEIALVYEDKKEPDKAVAQYRKAQKSYDAAGEKDLAASMVSSAAKVYQHDKQYDKALVLFQEALKLRTALSQKDGIGEAWWDLGYHYGLQKDFDKADEDYRKAVSYYLEDGKKESAAILYNNLSITNSTRKNYKQAVDFAQKSLVLRKEIGDKDQIAKSLQQIASVYWEAKDFAQAKVYYTQALTAFQEAQDKEGEIYTMGSVAQLYYFYEKDYKKAEILFNQALDLAGKIKDNNILAYCYSGLADLNELKGDFQQYKAFKEKALALYEKLDDKLQTGYTIIGIGTFYAGRGDFEKATDYYKKAVTLGESIPNDRLVANAYTRMAWIESYRGEFAITQERLEKALNLYQKAGDDLGMADVYFSMGQNHITSGEYQIAENYLNKTDSIYALNRMENARADLNNAKGRLYYYQQDLQKSFQFHKADYDLRVKSGDMSENLRVATLNVGECLAILKRYEEGLVYLQKSLALSEKNQDKRGKALSYELLGETKLSQKKYAEAEKYLAQALQIHKEMKAQERIAATLRLQAKLFYETKRYPEAIKIAEEGVQVSHKIGSDFYLWENLNVLGDVYRTQNQKLKSITYYKEAIETLERIRNKIVGGEEAQKLFSSGESKIKVYEMLIDLLLKQGEVEEAMEYLQRNNQGELQDRFKNIKINYQNDSKDKIKDEERSQKLKIESLDKQLSAEKSKPETEQNLEKIQSLEKVKTVAANEYVNFVRKNLTNSDADRFVDLRLQRTKIPKDMAVISYLPGEKQLYIFVATKDSAVARLVPVTNQELQKRITYVRGKLRNHDASMPRGLSSDNQEKNRTEVVSAAKQNDEFLKNLEWLYQNLIAPVQDVVQSKTKLAIMPSGDLHFLPFQVLAKTLPDGNLNFLVENFNIFYTKDFKMLSRTDKIESEGLKIIAFANPDKSLPATEREVNEIKKSYPNTQAFYKEDATEDKAKNLTTEYNVMHFATHGNLDYSRPEKSFLTMAKNLSKGEDGQLSLQDLWGLELMSNLNLVVLSACNTAMSSSAEIPISPATGFFDNGVKSVVASLWKVNDDATSLLMADFYNNLKTMEVSEALRQAQLKLTQNPKFRHPYYWAPFILMGDWK